MSSKKFYATFTAVFAGLLPMAALAKPLDAVIKLEPQETYGTLALGFLLDAIKSFAHEGAAFINNFAVLSKLSSWIDKQSANPAVYDQWIEIGQILALTLVSAFVAKYFIQLILFPMRSALRKKEIHVAYLRIGSAFMRYVLMLLPSIVFLGVSMLVVSKTSPATQTEAMVLTIVYALTLYQLVEASLRFIFAPRSESLRFLPISNDNAVFMKRWSKWYSIVLIFGTYLAEMAIIIKVPKEAVSAFQSLVALTVIVMTIIVILKKKSTVSVALRGNLSAAATKHNFIDNLRLWAARMWHILAIAYLVIGYFVTMLGAEGGFWIMQQGTIGTLLAIVGIRFLLFLASRIVTKKKKLAVSGGLYRPVARILLKILTWVGGLAAILASWGVDISTLAISTWGQRIIGSFFSITTSLLMLVAIYEALHFFIERKLYKKDDEGNVIEADARMRTLLPMARNVGIFVLLLIAFMVVLTEIGIDTAPLLAGAGVLGVALGFGSQTLVKDFLGGMFILIEDTMAVGDYVTLAGHSGTVEAMSIRTVKLRDTHGAVYIIPFSSISDIVNMSKDFAYAVLDMDVDYDSDLDKVQEIMMRVGNMLCEDPEYKDRIMEPISLVGIQAFANSSITVRCRIKTVGGKQWGVRRAFYALIKPAFDAEGIEIPFPHVVQVRKQVVNTQPLKVAAPKAATPDESLPES